MSQLFEKELSYRVIELCFRVHNSLRAGLLEYVYKAAMAAKIRIFWHTI